MWAQSGEACVHTLSPRSMKRACGLGEGGGGGEVEDEGLPLIKSKIARRWIYELK